MSDHVMINLILACIGFMCPLAVGMLFALAEVCRTLACIENILINTIAKKNYEENE